MLDEPSLPSAVGALLQLAVRSQDALGNSLENLLRIDTTVMRVERIGYWSIRNDPASIACVLAYSASTHAYERGVTLLERDIPEYFREIRKVKVLAVDDVTKEARVAGLEPYFASNGIGAMLDVPVVMGRHVVGVLCHEHVGGPRRWSEHEQELALGVSHALSAMLEAHERSCAERRARRGEFLAGMGTVLAQGRSPEEVCQAAVRRAVPELAELALLVGIDGDSAQILSVAHARDDLGPLLDSFATRITSAKERPNAGVQALRRHASLLVPCFTESALRERGITEDAVHDLLALRVLSAMAVPLVAPTGVIGALVLAAADRQFDTDDLALAEDYAHEIATMLENARLHRESEEAVRARDEFLQVASHELRTPMSSLQLHVDGLARLAASRNDPPLSRLSTAIGRSVARIGRLIRKILDTAEIGAGRLALNREPVDLAALVREVSNRFAATMDRAGSELVVHTDGPVIGDWDRERIDQLLSSLLENAAKFGPGKPVAVSVSRRDGRARVSVVDHGIGIPPSQTGDIFGRFVRAVPLRAFGGLGLGLYVADAIARAHGGKIEVATREGEGAVFTVELPLARLQRAA